MDAEAEAAYTSHGHGGVQHLACLLLAVARYMAQVAGGTVIMIDENARIEAETAVARAERERKTSRLVDAIVGICVIVVLVYISGR
jgi:hypothetical protein